MARTLVLFSGYRDAQWQYMDMWNCSKIEAGTHMISTHGRVVMMAHVQVSCSIYIYAPHLLQDVMKTLIHTTNIAKNGTIFHARFGCDAVSTIQKRFRDLALAGIITFAKTPINPLYLTTCGEHICPISILKRTLLLQNHEPLFSI